jgi:peroxiredoxin
MAVTLEIGQSAPDLDLPGVDGKRYSLASFADAQVLVVVFSCNHCPYVVGSEDRMNALHADYATRGVEMIAINSNETENHPADSMEHMVQRARDKGFRFPYVRDESQDVARAYGALRTPHFYVFDSRRTLRYTGRMDDNPRVADQAKTHELCDAVEAILEGRDPPVTRTNPIGCNVKWKGHEAHWMPPEACDLV